jgi:molybdenum cofactor cytidylyltransferase
MICALILAAGRARRMGTQKLLLQVGGRPLVARIVDEVLCAPVDHVCVVIPPGAARLPQALVGRAVSFVTNPDPQAEMLDSVRCGLRALPPSCTGVLVVLGDQPGVHAGLVADLVRAFRESGRGLVLPVCEGRRGHPLLVAARYCEEILNGYDATGLRGLLQAHPEDVLEVQIPDPASLEDMDEPADYQRLAAKFAARPTPLAPE